MANMTKRGLLVAVIVFIVLLAIPIAIGNFYASINASLTSQAVSQGTTQTDLTATAVKIKLDDLVALATSIASLNNFSQAIANQNWTNAADIARDLANNPQYYDPDVDRMVIYDASGTQQAAYPELVGAIGMNYATSSFFMALTSGQSSYVNGVTLRLSIPRIQVVNIAVPVKVNGAMVGALVLQVPAASFLEFSDDVALGTYGFAYIVDQSGNLVSDPHSSDQDGTPVNVSALPSVAAALAGGDGTTLAFDPLNNEESVVSYKNIPSYGWAVITQQPYSEVFSTRDSILSLLIFAIIATFFIDLFVCYVVLWLLSDRKGTKPASESKRKKKGFTLIELLVVIAIIAVLAVVVILTLNPAELLKQSRDSGRISDLSTLKTAISLYIVDATTANIASSSLGYGGCYISATGANATTTAKCGVFVGGYSSDVTSTATNYRNINSTGWLPINFSQLSFGSPFGSLPVDPSNNGNNYYAYAATSSGGYFFEIDTFMESKKFGSGGSNDVVTTDGGDNSSTYETGNKSGLNL